MTEQQLPTWFLDSLSTLFVSYLLATVVGITLGLAMGLNRPLEVMVTPYVAPIAALVPVIILIGGPSFTSRVFVVFLFAVFEITFDTYEGVKMVPDELLDGPARSAAAGGFGFVTS